MKKNVFGFTKKRIIETLIFEVSRQPMYKQTHHEARKTF